MPSTIFFSFSGVICGTTEHEHVLQRLAEMTRDGYTVTYQEVVDKDAGVTTCYGIAKMEGGIPNENDG